jgi:predicted transglutaminase-like protease
MLVQNLRNHIAAFVFNSFFLMFLKLRIVLACWALIYLILHFFHAVVLYKQAYFLPSTAQHLYMEHVQLLCSIFTLSSPCISYIVIIFTNTCTSI